MIRVPYEPERLEDDVPHAGLTLTRSHRCADKRQTDEIRIVDGVPPPSLGAPAPSLQFDGPHLVCLAVPSRCGRFLLSFLCSR